MVMDADIPSAIFRTSNKCQIVLCIPVTRRIRRVQRVLRPNHVAIVMISMPLSIYF